jgi:DNA-directed RNA polymerase subunit RPC12/RpoP
MERGLSYNLSEPSPPPPSALKTTAAPKQQKRLRGLITSVTDQGGTVGLASRRFPYRLIDLVGQQRPQVGESVTFILRPDAELGGYRAQKLILDSEPHYLEGRDSLHQCYQAYASKRARQQAALERQAKPVAEATAQGAEHYRCDQCQKMVLPKQQRKEGRWLHFCPYCNGQLDEDANLAWRMPLLLMLLLSLCLYWWQF